MAIAKLGDYPMTASNFSSLVFARKERRIIRRMGHIKDMYKLVRWVDNKIKGHDASTPEVARRGDKYRISGASIREEYAKESDKSDAKIRDLVESCKREEYLETEDDTWFIINPGKGKRFLRKFGCIPSGFTKEVINDDKHLVGVITAIIITICTIVNVYMTIRK